MKAASRVLGAECPLEPPRGVARYQECEHAFFDAPDPKKVVVSFADFVRAGGEVAAQLRLLTAAGLPVTESARAFRYY